MVNFVITVKDEDNNELIPNAKVTITSVDLENEKYMEESETGDYGDDEAGKCDQDLPEGANYTVRVCHPRYLCEDVNVDVPQLWHPNKDGTCSPKMALTVNLNYDPDKIKFCPNKEFMVVAKDKNSDDEVPFAYTNVALGLADKECEDRRKINENATCSLKLTKTVVLTLFYIID